MAAMDRGAYVRMLSAVYAAMFLIRVAFGITIVTFAQYLPSGDVVYSLVVSASPLFELVTVIFCGLLIDRYGRKGVLLTGLGLGAISLYGMALTTDPLMLAGVNALHGVAAALILVTTLAIIATYAPAAHRGREMGLFNLANLFGWIVGFIAGFLMLDGFAGRLEYTFVIAGALATVGLLYANRMIHLPHEARGVGRSAPPSTRELAQAVGNRHIILLTLPWLIVFVLVGALLAFLPRVTGDLDIRGWQTALGVLGVGGLLVVSQLFWGRLADRHGREAIMLIGGAGFALLMGVIVFAFFESPDHIVTRAVDSFEVAPGAAAFTIMAAAAAPEDPGDPVPVVEGVEPREGPPGTEVRLSGRGFANVTDVHFNGRAAEFNVTPDGRTLTTSVPDGATTGPLELSSPTPPQVVFRNVMSHWLILTVFLFLALAFAPAGLAAIADEAKEGAQGTTMSAYSLTLSLGFIIGPPTLGTISERFGGTGMVVFYAVLAAALFGMVLTRFIQSRTGRA